MSKLHEMKVNKSDRSNIEKLLKTARESQKTKQSERAHRLRNRVTQMVANKIPLTGRMKKVVTTLYVEEEERKAEAKRAKAEKRKEAAAAKKALKLKEAALQIEPSNIAQVTDAEVPKV